MFTVFFGSPNCGELLQSNASYIDEDFEKAMLQIRYIAYQIIGPALIIAGILGNILNLIVLARPFLNDCTRTYLRALAIADMHVLIFDIPMIVRLNHIESGTLWVAIYFAHFELVLVTTFIAFNVYVVLCLTVDRYISVCFPTMFNAIHTPRKAKVAIVLCFAMAIIVSLPLFMMKRICRTNATCRNWSYQDHTEVVDTTYWYAYLTISETVIRIGPAVLLAILNILIIRKFGIITKNRDKIHKPLHQLTNAARNRKYQDEKRLVVLLQAVVVLFFITMIPSSCLSFLYTEFRETCLTFQIFRAIANLLEIANSALNFCAYFLCSKEFRKGLLNVFIGCNKPKLVTTANVNGVKPSVMKTISNEFMNNVLDNKKTETLSI